MNFERFEQLFKECISNAAIQTKFEHHYRRGMEVVRSLEELLAEEEDRHPGEEVNIGRGKGGYRLACRL